MTSRAISLQEHQAIRAMIGDDRSSENLARVAEHFRRGITTIGKIAKTPRANVKSGDNRLKVAEIRLLRAAQGVRTKAARESATNTQHGPDQNAYDWTRSMALNSDTTGIRPAQENTEFARPIGEIVAPIIDRVIDAAMARGVSK